MRVRLTILPVLMFVSYASAFEEQSNFHTVNVWVSVNADGKPGEMKIESGDARFYEAALKYARSADYGVKCNEDGKRIPFEVTLALPFTRNGKIVGAKTRRPIRVGSGPGSRRIYHVNPKYPPEARRQRIQGIVVVKIYIDERGAVTKTEVIRGHPLLRDAAVAAVSKWRYKPLFLNCQPVPSIATTAVNFVLR